MLLRIYGRTHGEQALETVLTDTVVFTLLSERKLGPKLHGIFPGGRIEQYIPVIMPLFLLLIKCRIVALNRIISLVTSEKKPLFKKRVSPRGCFILSKQNLLIKLTT